MLPGTEHRAYLGGELTPSIGSFAVAEWAATLRITRTAAQRLIADRLLAIKAPELRRRRVEQVRARREVYIEHTDDDRSWSASVSRRRSSRLRSGR